jgi:hypothetical protein
MAWIEKVNIDIRVERGWCEGVTAYQDRDRGTLHLPEESARKVGEIDSGTGDLLIRGVPDMRREEVFGQPMWTGLISDLRIRPHRARRR